MPVGLGLGLGFWFWFWFWFWGTLLSFGFGALFCLYT